MKKMILLGCLMPLFVFGDLSSPEYPESPKGMNGIGKYE